MNDITWGDIWDRILNRPVVMLTLVIPLITTLVSLGLFPVGVAAAVSAIVTTITSLITQELVVPLRKLRTEDHDYAPEA